MELMVNLRELHVEGARCWPDTTHLQGRLLNLEKLRITRSQSETLADISTSFMDKTKLEILDLSGSLWVKVLPTCLSKACSLQVLLLDGCEELETVVIPDGLPSSLRSFSFDSYGPVFKHWIPCPDLPPDNLRPSSPDDDRQQQAAKTSKISLEGCTRLENLFVRGLPNLVELDLSGTAIKMLNFETMVVQVPGLKRLFLLGCEHLRGIRWDKDRFNLELLCIDTRTRIRGRTLQPSLGHRQKKSCFLLHAVLVDARLVRSLHFPILHHKNRSTGSGGNDFQFSIHFTSSSMNSGSSASSQQLEGTCSCKEKQMEELSPGEHMRLGHQVPAAIPYPDVPDLGGDVPMQDSPQPFPPASSAVDHRYIEVTQGSRNLQGELTVMFTAGREIMEFYAEFLHVHDASIATSFPGGNSVRWFRVERCPNMEAVFSVDSSGFRQLETFWASDLLRARCIWSKSNRLSWRGDFRSFDNLRHLHLRSCPKLEFVLYADGTYSLPSLETLHIIHCGELRHVFVPKGAHGYRRNIARGVTFPKLTTIRLHDLPLLLQICVVKTLTPKLRSVKISGCWGMRRLSTVVDVVATGDDQASCSKPTVEIEKEVWEALEWDGADAGHHHSLFEMRHSRYYKKKTVRGALLR